MKLSKEEILKNLDLIIIHGSKSKWVSVGILKKKCVLKSAINIGTEISKNTINNALKKIGTETCVILDLKEFLALIFLEAPEAVIKIICTKVSEWENDLSDAQMIIYNGSENPIIQSVKIKRPGIQSYLHCGFTLS